MLPVPWVAIDRSRRMPLQSQSRHFEGLNETRRQLGGHPSSTTSRLNLMRSAAAGRRLLRQPVGETQHDGTIDQLYALNAGLAECPA
jgi:hypothetical protein